MKTLSYKKAAPELVRNINSLLLQLGPVLEAALTRQL